MAALTNLDVLRASATCGSAIVAGIQLAFSLITVPMLEAPEPGLTPFQRWRMWRKAFERGQATIPTGIFGATGLLAVAAYATEIPKSRNILIGAIASMLGVIVVTPIIMLGANLRGELLNSVKSKEDEAKAEKYVERFKIFQAVRVSLTVLATALSAYDLLLHKA